MGEVVHCDPSQSIYGWRPPEGWPGWIHVVSIIANAVPETPYMFMTRLEAKLALIGYFSRTELLTGEEMADPRADHGFRASWGLGHDQHILVMTDRLGFLKLRCHFEHHVFPEVGSFESEWFNPNDYANQHFNEAIEYLLERPTSPTQEIT